VGPRARSRLGIGLALVAAAVCVRLGLWQLSRLHQRQARNARIRAAQALPPVQLSGRVAADSLANRRVQARGVYDFAHERLWRPRLRDDQPGVDLVTPLKFPDGSAVLVDRGWVPSPDAYHVDETLYRAPDSGAVTGIALEAPRGRGDVDPARLSDSLPYPLLPFVVQLLPSPSVSVRPFPPAPQPWPAPELSNGPHLSYIIQWFSFAVIILAGSALLFRRRDTGAAPAG